jgi:hypothetical protein
VGTYGLTTNSTTPSAGQDAYTRLGLPDQGSGTASESYTNWAAAAAANGFSVLTMYSLDVFAAPASITGKQGISLSEAGLTKGSFVILYSCETTSAPAGGPCADPGTPA